MSTARRNLLDHDISVRAQNNALELFEPDPIETVLRERRHCISKPTTTIQGSGPIEVIINGERRSFIDTASIRVNASFQVKRLNENQVPINIPAVTAQAPIDVYPVNLLSRSVFKDVECELDSTKISLNASNTYGIKSYLTTLISYGDESSKGLLQTSYFNKDTPGKFDTFADNAGGQARHSFIKESKVVHICDNIYTELTSTNRYLVPGVDVKFRFLMESPSVFLVSKRPEQNAAAPNHVIVFHDFNITYDRIFVKDNELADIEKSLAVEPAIYPITRSEIRTKGFAGGLSSIEWNNAYQGVLPETVIVAMNTQTAADGNQFENIYNFQHFTMKDMTLIVNSKRMPATPLRFDFERQEARQAYRHFFDNIGIDITNSPTLMTYEDFLGGSTLIPFDLTNDRCAMYHGHEKQEGTISIELHLRQNLEQPINMYCICIYRDHFYIMGTVDNRRVSTTYPTKK